MHGGILAGIFLLVVAVGFFPVRSGDAALNPRLNVSQLSFTGLASSAPLVAQTEFSAAPQPLTVRAPDVSEGTLLGADDVTAAELEGRELATENSSIEVEDAETVQSRRVAMYQNYVVQEGDTLTSISESFGIGQDYLVWNNLDIDNPNRLSPGIQIIVPFVEGIVHAVEFDETLSEIARRYDANADDILAFEANSLADPNSLRADTLIFVPYGRIVPIAAPSIRPGAGAAPPPITTGAWLWPANTAGTLTSRFGPGHWLGIDIAMPVGNEIVAARAGVVTFAGGDPWVSYGYYIKVDHDDGWETTYAHLNDFAPGIQNGTWVNQGDVIGYSGNTGNSTGPHLHFETRWWGDPSDPLELLQ